MPTGQFPPPDLLQQTLASASYAGVSFPLVTPMPTKGGNTFIRHRAYRRQGVDLEYTQEKEKEGTIKVCLVNELQGFVSQNVFPGTYYDLKQAFSDHPIATMTHPSLGQFTAGVSEWEEEWDADVRNGLFVTFQWIEHNASSGLLLADTGQTPQNSMATANTQAAVADAAVLSVTSSATYAAMIPLVNAMLTALAVSSNTPNAVIAACTPVLSAIAANLALPVLNNVASVTAVTALEALRVTVLAIQSKTLTSELSTQVFSVPADMAVWQIAQLATGDIGNAGLIEQFNTIPNPNLVRRGTVLTVPIITVS